MTQPSQSAPFPSTGSRDLAKLLQGILVESTDAEAILFLANYHNKYGQYEIAAAFCNRLLDYPGPEQGVAKALLREIKSRLSHGMRTRSQAVFPTDRNNDDSSFLFSP